MSQLQKWQMSDKLPADLKAMLASYSQAELNEAFSQELEFGTAGMRGLLGAGINRMNVFTVGKANFGYGKYLLESFPNQLVKVAIAYDNRHYSHEFAFTCAKQLAKLGIQTYIFDSLRPTPELSFAVRHLGCQGGIVITASHNPKEYNGYKVYDETGCQLTPDKIERVISLVNELTDELSLDFQVDETENSLIKVINTEIDQPYQAAVLSIQLQPELFKNLKIVFSPQHGTAHPLLTDILLKAGYDVILVSEQATPDPDFSQTKSPNPEDQAAYELAITIAKKKGADIILTTDPDADRMGIVVKHQDEYHYLTGNQGGTILLEYILSTRKRLGTLPSDGIIYNTIVTSDAGEKIAQHYGVKTEKTLTGFKFIGEKIQQAELTQSATFLMGYEESYGYLLADFVRDKDALQSCLMLAEAANYYKSQGKTLIDVLDSCFALVGVHHEVTESLSFSGSAGLKQIAALMNQARFHPLTKLANQAVVYVEDYLNLTRKIGTLTEPLAFAVGDVMKYGLADGSWIAIRPSGTEPKCKIYYCIVGQKGEVIQKYQTYQAAIHQWLKLD